MRLQLDILEQGINIGSAQERLLLDTETNETITMEKDVQQKPFAIYDYDNKNKYEKDIEEYLLSIGLEEDEAKAISKLAGKIAKKTN